jgi:lysophospholipase L1-like esterase
MKTLLSLTTALVACAVPLSWSAELPLIDSMDDISTIKAPEKKGSIEQVEGKTGKAVKFTYEDDCKSSFAFTRIRGKPEWDQAAGFSFWVKGDGSAHSGCLHVVWNEDYAQRYDVAFPLSNKDWTKVIVAWSDLTPSLSNANSKPLDPKGDRPPSKLGAMWVGKWWYWRDCAAHSFAIDDVRLEPTIEQDTKDYRPAGAPLARVYAKLKAGMPITVVTMGDSLTDYKHNSNQKTNWPTFFKAALKDTYKSDATIDNPAIGGTELRQNLTMIPNWVATTPKPDLVTVCFGGNDWNGGMRGEMFTATMKEAIQRIRRVTKGEADVLVITTLPGVETWDTTAELAEACRVAAKDEKAGLCDASAVFHELGKTDKERLYHTDKVHLGKPGQEAMAKAVLDAIEANGK